MIVKNDMIDSVSLYAIIRRMKNDRRGMAGSNE